MPAQSKAHKLLNAFSQNHKSFTKCALFFNAYYDRQASRSHLTKALHTHVTPTPTPSLTATPILLPLLLLILRLRLRLQDVRMWTCWHNVSFYLRFWWIGSSVALNVQGNDLRLKA